MAETEQFLHNVPLFSGLTPEQLQQVARMAEQCTFAAGTDICKEGDPGGGMYIVMSGMAKVAVKPPKGGKEAVVSLLKGGDTFGILALLDDQPRSATVSAMGNTQCLYLRREDFLQLVQQHPQIAVALLPALSEMVRSANRWVEQLL